MIDRKLEPLKNEINDVRIQVEQTERILKNEIRKSEYLILDEVERVHSLLEEHKNDKTVHTA